MVLSPAQNYPLLETRLIWIQDRMLERSWKTNAITVEEIPVWLVRQGRLMVQTGEDRIEATAGHWVFPQQGQGWVHTLPRTKILSLRFRLCWPNGREVYRRRKTLVLPSRKWPGLIDAASAMLDLLEGQTLWYADQWEPRSCSAYLAMQARFQNWLAAYGTVMEAQGEPDDVVEEADAPALAARQALLEWKLAKPFSRKALAKQLGVGIQTLSRRFAMRYGTTPRVFLEQRKLQWAQQRLARDRERIKVIASELGFSNLAQFSTWFRLRSQLSPRAYRQWAQEKR